MNLISQIAAMSMFGVLVILIGCSKTESTESVTMVAIEPLPALTTTQVAQKKRAIDAKDKLSESLFAELMNSMGKNGPAKSINVCKTRAPEIASVVSAETGVRIGRTSFKLRNESNVAPDWARSFVEAKVEEPIEVALPHESWASSGS